MSEQEWKKLTEDVADIKAFIEYQLSPMVAEHHTCKAKVEKLFTILGFGKWLVGTSSIVALVVWLVKVL